MKKNSNIKNFEDLRGKKACFPSFEGIAWNSMLYSFHRRGLLSYECPYSIKATNFFGDMCVPGAPKNASEKLRKLCNLNYEGDVGALKCFTFENADVVFVSKNMMKNIISGPLSSEKWVTKLVQDGTRMICEDEFKPCELSWATISQAMIRSDTSEMNVQETFDIFMQLDSLFGNYYKSLTRSFSLYGPFDGIHDVLFHDETDRLRGNVYMKRVEHDVPNYDIILKDVSKCLVSSGTLVFPSIAIIILSIFTIYY